MKFEKSQAAIDRLTPEQHRITQSAGTERPFTGEYNDNDAPGIRQQCRDAEVARRKCGV